MSPLKITLRAGWQCETHPLTALTLYLRGDAVKLHTDLLEPPERELWEALLHELHAKIGGAPYWLQNVPPELEQIVLGELTRKGRITADDVFTLVTEAAPNRDPRVVGSVLQALARQGKIQAVGSTTTKRPGTHGARIAIWAASGA